MNDLSNIGILMQIIGILIAFPIKLIIMYSYTLKKIYHEVMKRHDEIVDNQAPHMYYDWLMFKIQMKISQIYWKKYFKYITKNFSRDFPESFRLHPLLVTIGGSLVIVGLTLTLK